MDKPSISVLMGVYNEKISWINESVESILHQTYQSFEFIIIDDNPNNNELRDYLLLLMKKDERIVVIFNECNIGLTKSLNKGLAVAKGEYIARMDADDISLKNRFEKQISYLNNHSECDAVYGYFYCFKDEDKSRLALKKSGPSNKKIISKLFLYNVLPHPLAMLRRTTLERYNLKYDENFVHSQDYDLWLMMAIKGCFFYVIPEPLLYYRISNNQITMSKSSSQNNFRLQAINKCLEQYFLSAGFDNQWYISRSFVDVLYNSIVSKRKWCDVDKQIFAMLYVTLNCKPYCIPLILYKSFLRYHFSIQQLVLVVISCFRTINTYQFKSLEVR